MKLVRTALVVTALVCSTAHGITPPAGKPKTPEDAIRAGTGLWMAAYNAGDPEAAVALYADDAVVMPPGAPVARGRAAIRAYLAKEVGASKAQGVTLALGAVHDVQASDDLAWDSGDYAVRDKSGATIDTGSFLTVWRKEGGKWHMIRDIWNSDRPAAPAGKTK